MVKYLLSLCLFIFSLTVPIALALSHKQVVPVYVYHLQPPLIINLQNNDGIYFEFVKRLNLLSNKYEFEVISIPRKRVERMLDTQSMQGILLGVNPKWFKDSLETKYLWTTEIISGRDEVVSLKSNSYEFNGAESLTGKVIGGVRGFYYYGVNELVLAKKAQRVDTVSEPDLMSMLLKQRVEVAIIGKLTFEYMVKQNNWQDKFYLSNIPHDIFARKILVPRDLAVIHQHLQQLNTIVQQDKTWQRITASYKPTER